MTPLHQERCRRLSAAMGEAGCDAVLVYGNAWQCDYVRYVTDFPVIEGEAMALFLADGETQLFVESLGDADRARLQTPHVRVVSCDDLIDTVMGHLARLGNRRIASAPATLMPYGIQRSEIAAKIEDGTAMIDRLLLAKSPLEIEAVRRAAEIADRGYRVFMDAVKIGRKEYELVADVEAFFREAGCPENFMILGSGGREVRGMHPPGERRIEHGDLVTTELTPAVDGYYAQVCRTLVAGEPSRAQLRAFDVYIEAVAAGHAILKAGVTAGAVAKAENDVFRKHDLGVYCTSEYTRVRGHGVGLFVDNPPHILEDVETVLPAGSTVIVHPNTYHPDVGYMVLGEVAVVNEGGYETFSELPRELLAVSP
jgi:Xaa-Pro aminopeptidase